MRLRKNNFRQEEARENNITPPEFKVQPDQINIAMWFWYLVKRDLPSVGYCTRVHRTSHCLHVTRKTRPCSTGHPVFAMFYNKKITRHTNKIFFREDFGKKNI